ncbi:nicotinate (nicotinamide) nucleotide adenylyltransferase [Helicobacter fennelliae]|uniref:Probable nicotinate-nucleotide adenylyltransferase n=2 Tax=Helicobacter fennelliae TaxID=215 RepID=T1CYS8_9HELI|nr:nicotinate (nicotinamide) nucleotide adenylyltransferase [Helicobacter fennelliae]GAD18111.1 probable nicotinate-nucleotide adenylyltransferase [Helicobacter fennelliae MRY12-0050]SQB98084.1 nicotinate-nucleotide adenylyltransferase [Helicobacter fennelliae]STP06705.1 nicotinate-nucleotide adenylyltransferase [Helicobacter fennelliae]
MNIAIFGGSFDPPHLGHLEIIERLHVDFDRLIVMPTFLSPTKSHFSAPPNKRFEWLCYICKGFKNVIVSDFEIAQNRVVYAIEWVEHFMQPKANLTLIIGADNAQSLPTWHQYHKLIKLVSFIVIARDGYKNTTSYPTLYIKNDTISSQSMRQELSQGKTPQGLITSIQQDVIGFYTNKKGAL